VFDVGRRCASVTRRVRSCTLVHIFVVGSAPADAEIDLTVNAYGIAHAHALGTTL
jgi:hypothetical protein